MAFFSLEAADWAMHRCPLSGRGNLQTILSALTDTEIEADLHMTAFWLGQRARRGDATRQWTVDIFDDRDHIVANLSFTWLDGKVNGFAILPNAVRR